MSGTNAITPPADPPAAESASAPHRHPMPFTRLEIALLALREGGLQVLLARRAEAPQAGRWALPGGVLRIDQDRSLEAAAARVARERTGLSPASLRQLCAVGGPTRDPRAPWALSVVYRALAPAEEPGDSAGAGDAPPAWSPVAGKRVQSLAWRPVDEAATDEALAFDHAELIAQAALRTREEVLALQWPAGFLPAQFTLGELQALSEAVLGHRLDKSSFRRKLAERALVEPVEGSWRGGANRPAQVYRLRG